MWKGEKGITGLETAIILIAFVVVASVFAYTALSAGLFSTQKSQQAIYSGISEAQSTLELKGGVLATGRAMLNNCDYIGWIGDTDATLSRETTTKWEGSASLKVVVGAGMSANDTIIYHAMQHPALTDGDTITFWIKADAALDSNMTFAIGPNADLHNSPTETYLINTNGGTGWQKHSFSLTGGDDSSAAYYGIVLSTDATGTFYLDNVIFDNVASLGGVGYTLDNCDYVSWVADSHVTLTSDASVKMEGTGSLKAVIGAGAPLNGAMLSHYMAAKSWADGDTITFWIKADAALSGKLTFAFATGANLQATATSTLLLSPATTGWTKETMTLSGGNNASARYYGIYLSTAATGTFYLDAIECKASVAQTTDPVDSYAGQVVMTVSLANGNQGIDFTTTTDSNSDGLLSDESVKNNKVTITYSDAYQTLTDLAWTRTPIGKDNGNAILDAGEKFQITVDLTAVNNGAAYPFEKVGPNHQFTIEVKPNVGAIMTVERTMPNSVHDINNLQ